MSKTSKLIGAFIIATVVGVPTCVYNMDLEPTEVTSTEPNENGIIQRGGTAKEVTDCMTLMRPYIETPKSINRPFGSIHYKDVKIDNPSQYALMLEFYADNQTGGEVRHLVKCTFNSESEDIVKVELENTVTGEHNIVIDESI